ncbi:PEP-CTERM sorting domain-containing protein [Oxalobacteraceae bacterium]|nr:PEP-CTERM sorting domain-containing protein [Oxalobacteraceae bacterium]
MSAGLLSGAAHAETLIFDSFGNATFGTTHGVGAFNDEYLFSVDDEQIGIASGTAAVGKTFTGFTRVPNYTITNVTFFKVNNDNSHSTLASTFIGAAPIEFYPNIALGEGTYGFTVSGVNALPGVGGSYAGNLNLVTSPVPEPATFGMLAIGLGLLAFRSRRDEEDTKLG